MKHSVLTLQFNLFGLPSAGTAHVDRCTKVNRTQKSQGQGKCLGWESGK